MCSIEAQLCTHLAEEFYGAVVGKVVGCMCSNGFQSLRYIANHTNLRLDQVKNALCVLIQHKLAVFQLHKQHVLYKADVENLLSLIFHPRIIYTAKLLYGDSAELIVEEILHHGIALMSTTIEDVVKRLQNFDNDGNLQQKVENAFRELVQTHFLQREPHVLVEDNTDEPPRIVPKFHIDEDDLYQLPSRSRAGDKRRAILDDSDEEPEAKRVKIDQKDDNEVFDFGINWSVNITRFEQFFRDQAVVAAVTKKHGVVCGEVIRAMLRISEVTTFANATRTLAISAAEISRALSSGFAISTDHINQHLRLLSTNSDKIVELADDSVAGGSYNINFKNVAFLLATCNVVSYVEERFGSKSCRIFRLLLLKQHLEQKQVEEFAMIPSKEAKEYLYNMLNENFLTMQELPRTADHAPSRTFYLFAVNIPKISRMLLMKAYKGIANLMLRQSHTKSTYKRLLNKRRQIEAMKESLKEEDDEQLQDIEDILSSAERGQLSKSISKRGSLEDFLEISLKRAKL